MDRSVIILAGGSSKRFGQDKAFAELAGKPLVRHVFEEVREVADEVIIVAGSEDRRQPFLCLFGDEAKIVADGEGPRCPLLGALTGFENSSGAHSLLISCDVPFVSKKVLNLLFKIADGVDAAIPRWPNDYIEPLQAVYMTRSAALAARMALSEGRRDMRSVIAFMKRVQYISTIILQQLDPGLDSFFNINTEADLKKAEQKARRKSEV